MSLAQMFIDYKCLLGNENDFTTIFSTGITVTNNARFNWSFNTISTENLIGDKYFREFVEPTVHVPPKL